MSYLYVSHQGATISYESNRVRVKYDDEILQEVLAETLESIQVYGNIQLTAQCMRECLKRGIDVVLFSSRGQYQGRLASPDHVHVARQRLQAAISPEFKLTIAKNIIKAKIKNQIVILRRYVGNDSNFRKEMSTMYALANCVPKAETPERLMGYEGAAARCYFGMLGEIIDPEFAFDKRTKKPPQDPFNGMISLGYARIHGEIQGKLEAKGLNPFFGVLHQDKEHHATLASDLMEEWRPVIVDSLVMSMLNGSEMTLDDFQYSERGAVYLTKDGFKKYALKLEQKFAKEQQYLGYVDYPVSFRMALDMQIGRLCQAIESGNPSLYMPIYIR